MKAVRIDRRQVLRGTGGITVALPFLPSLYPRRADGAELVPGLKPCFAAMTTVHGAVLEQNMYPATSTLTQSTVHLPGHTIKSGPLQGTTLSPVLKSASLTSKLVSKLNVLRGFDYPYYIGHHNGGHLGNFVRSDQGPKNMAAFATIDQIMANSPSFYPDLACGTSRVATISLPAGTYGNHSGNWHQDVAHNAGSNQPKLTECLQRSFDLVFVDLMKKLEALEVAPGVTALDLSLVQWTQEAGWNTHDAQDMAIVTAGSAHGFFKTGLFVDYRSTKKMKMFGSYQQQMLGLMHRQWLATALQAMGVPPSEFEKNSKAGYGDPLMSADYVAAVPAPIHQNASQPVPVLT